MEKNRKKHYLPNLLTALFAISVGAFAIAGGIWLIYLTIKSLVDNTGSPWTVRPGEFDFFANPFTKVIFLIICFAGIALFLYAEETFFIEARVVLDDEKIFCSKGFREKWSRAIIQYATSVRFVDMKTISFTFSKTNSKGRKVTMIRPIPFLYIKDKNDKVYRFFITFYSARRIKKLLNDILERCHNNGNDIEIDIPRFLKEYRRSRFETVEFGEEVVTKVKKPRKRRSKKEN